MKKILILFLIASLIACSTKTDKTNTTSSEESVATPNELTKEHPLTVDSAEYIQKVNFLINGDTTGLWPVKNQPIPLYGAILPFKRIVAYYGNLYSKKIGRIGRISPC